MSGELRSCTKHAGTSICVGTLSRVKFGVRSVERSTEVLFWSSRAEYELHLVASLAVEPSIPQQIDGPTYALQH